jgi:hypothetical protein
VPGVVEVTKWCRGILSATRILQFSDPALSDSFSEAAELLGRACKAASSCQALHGLLTQALETPLSASETATDGWRTELLMFPPSHVEQS